VVEFWQNKMPLSTARVNSTNTFQDSSLGGAGFACPIVENLGVIIRENVGGAQGWHGRKVDNRAEMDGLGRPAHSDVSATLTPRDTVKHINSLSPQRMSVVSKSFRKLDGSQWRLQKSRVLAGFMTILK
jgi:hypothetical protein